MWRRTLFGAGLAWLTLATASLARETRVAVVAGERQEAAEAVVAMAEAKLSGAGEIVLLQRDEIRRVLAEQKLSLNGLVNASQAVAAGHMLSVDLFASVEAQRDAKTAQGLVVFDARTGARLADVALPAEAMPAAEIVAKSVEEAAAKREQIALGKLRTISLLTVRNADLPRAQDAMCESVGLLLERGLPRSPDLAVLERRRLERVNEERVLPGAEARAGLLASVVMMELEIGRAAEGKGLRATLRWSESGGKRELTVQTPEPSPGLLAEMLLGGLLEALRAAPAAMKPDASLEAARFDREAELRMAHGEMEEAVRAAEAAFALDPANVLYQQHLSFDLVRLATWMFSPAQLSESRSGEHGWEQTHVARGTMEALLGRAERAIDLSRNLLLRGALRDEWRYLVRFDPALETFCERLRCSKQNWQAGEGELLAQALARSVDFIGQEAGKAEGDPSGFDHYSAVFQSQTALLKVASADSRIYAETMFRLVQRWVAITQAWPASAAKWNGGEAFNMLLSAMTNERVHANWPWLVDHAVYAARLEPLFGAMQKHARPSVRLYGLAAELRAGVALHRLSAAEAQARFTAEYRPQAEAIITHPAPWHLERTRQEVYEAWRGAINEVQREGSFAAQEYEALGRFLLSRGELRSKVIESVLAALPPQASLAMGREMMAILPEAKLDDPAMRAPVRSLLQRTEAELLARHPELARGGSNAPWKEARRILAVEAAKPVEEFARVLVTGKEEALVVGFEQEGTERFLRLLRVGLRDGAVTRLGRARIPLAEVKPLTAYERVHFVTALAVESGSVMVATHGAGVLIFPLDGGAPRQLGAGDGLPSEHISSAALLGGKLYAGFSEGYLISFDLKENRLEVLASSRRAEKRSPFDDRAPFAVPYMVADVERGRVLFVIDHSLWQLTPSDGKISEVVDLQKAQTDRAQPKLDGTSLNFGSEQPVAGKIVLSTPFRAVQVDLRENTARVLHQPNDGVFQMWPPHLLVGDVLWTSEYFAGLALSTRTQVRFPPFPGERQSFRPRSLQAIPESGAVLVSDERSLWRLEVDRR